MLWDCGTSPANADRIVGNESSVRRPTDEFEPALYMLSSVLTYCDMTTSSDGDLVPVE